jgi:serine palmitoyltransferase
MGYNKNTSTLASLMTDNGTLIISDSLNHTSIVNGSRASKAQIRVFRNNDTEHLEEVLSDAIVQGQPRHHRPWKKILVVVEGIYSMEGAICRLKEVVRVAKKYKAYLYVDEAHSIGALGATGRGVCEYAGVNPADIDILMGTFTKSFSGMGGYIAGSKETIDYIRSVSEGILFHNSMSPVVSQQILTAFRVISGADGTNFGHAKIQRLISNSNFFRQEMKRLGLHVYGDYDSPIIPIMIYFPAKIAAFSRECLARGLAVVVVGFPATSVILSRVRFCISAGHTREDLQKAVKIIDEVTTLLCMKYDRSELGL